MHFGNRKLLPVLCLLFLWPGICKAHGVNLFCWTDRDTVQCRARFSGGRAVHNGTWRVLEASSGNELLSGATSSEGRFSFDPPPGARKDRIDLEVVCEANMGHRDSWTVRAGDYISGLSAQEGNDGSATDQGESAGPQESVDGIGEERLRRILSQELSPLRKELARLGEPGVRLRDVIGGLGYILGLFGIWAYAASRRESR
jgi:nickel transport protein